MRTAVSYLYDLELAGGEIRDCRTCNRPESHCASCPIETGAQPRLSFAAQADIRLHARMKRWSALPELGGLLDQDEALMRRLDMIDQEFNASQERHSENERARAELRAKLGR